MKTPEIQPISWGDRFKVKQDITNKEKELIFDKQKTYVINGLGKKFIDGKPYKCWSIVSGIDEMLIPIETITAIYKKGLIINL